MSKHTGGTWIAGKKAGSVVTDSSLATERDLAMGNGEIDYYGGLLIAESVTPQNIPVISAGPELLKSLKEIISLAVEWGKDPKYYTQAESNIIGFAESAIAKAEGRI